MTGALDTWTEVGQFFNEVHRNALAKVMGGIEDVCQLTPQQHEQVRRAVIRGLTYERQAFEQWLKVGYTQDLNTWLQSEPISVPAVSLSASS